MRFALHPVYETWGDWIMDFFVYPFGLYFVWLCFFGFFNFVITSKVSSFEIECTYKYFGKDIYLPKWLGPIRNLPLEIVFLLGHFAWFAVAHLLAIIQFYCYYLNLVTIVILLQIAVYNGACFYMDYFSKRYEKQLAKLDQLEEVVI